MSKGAKLPKLAGSAKVFPFEDGDNDIARVLVNDHPMAPPQTQIKGSSSSSSGSSSSSNNKGKNSSGSGSGSGSNSISETAKEIPEKKNAATEQDETESDDLGELPCLNDDRLSGVRNLDIKRLGTGEIRQSMDLAIRPTSRASKRVSVCKPVPLGTSLETGDHSELSEKAQQRHFRYPGIHSGTIKSHVYKRKTTCRENTLFVLTRVWFSVFLCALVVASLGMMFAAMFNVDLPLWTQTAEIVIIGIFALETSLRLFAMGAKAYFADAICRCDLFVTCIDIIILCIEEWVVGGGNGNETESLSVIRVLRVTRLSKITRVARIFRFASKVDEMHEGGVHMKKALEVDENGRIFDYNPENLMSIGWMFHLTGTVVAMPEIWVWTLILLIISTLFAAITCPLECDPRQGMFDPDSADCSGCTNSIDPSYGLMFLGLAAFLLSIFSSQLFDRWWTMRLRVQDLFAEIKNTAMMVHAFLRDVQDEEQLALRDDVIRWSVLGAYLLQKKIEHNHNYRDAVLKGYLTESEWDRIERIDCSYVFPHKWMLDSLSEAAHNGLNQNSVLCNLMEYLLMSVPRQRVISDEILTILDTPIPYVFLHLITIICKINLIFTAVSCGTYVGHAIMLDQWLQVVLGYCIVVFASMLIDGLLRLQIILSDPFGDDSCDFPWERMVDGLEYEVNLLTGKIYGNEREHMI